MVILQSKPGRLGNRVFYFAYFIANAKAYNYRLYNPNFSEYTDYFPKLHNQKVLGGRVKLALPQNALFQWIYPRLCWHLPRKDKKNWFHQEINADKYLGEYDLNQKEFWQAAKRKLCWVSGWNFRDHQNLQKYHATIKDIFSPEASVLGKVTSKLHQHKSETQTDQVVGVHIRKTDYADFYGGKYYFELPFYVQKMKEARQVLEQEGKKVCFLVCSDEHFAQEKFEGLPVLQNQGSPIEDLYTLAHTDYLFGPPSTFSMWASYWGKVPLCMLDSDKKIIEKESFSPIISLDRFENGKKFTHS